MADSNEHVDKTSPGATTPQQSHLHHRGRRLRKFLKPDGGRVHIAATPEEHVKLQQTLPHIEPDDNFEVHIHGSAEHLAAVRLIHAHHEERHQNLRTKHSDIYEEFEAVRGDLDNLAEELNNLSEHGVSLDANFSKYGYDAQIRTKEPDSSGNSISESRRSSSVGKRDWDAEQRQGAAIKFYRKPVVRQYFHKGLLWRASEVEEVASFELFVDLLYVGIIAVIGDKAADDATAYGLLRFSIAFVMGYKMWNDLTLIISWFGTYQWCSPICRSDANADQRLTISFNVSACSSSWSVSSASPQISCQLSTIAGFSWLRFILHNDSSTPFILLGSDTSYRWCEAL